MTDAAEDTQTAKLEPIDIAIDPIDRSPDFSSIMGLIFAVGLIIVAIVIGENANFVNIPSILIVVLGTMAVTAISFSAQELKKVISILGQSFTKVSYNPQRTARQLMELSDIARKSGLLALSNIDGKLRNDPHLADAVQVVTDGYNAQDVSYVLAQDIDALEERHRTSANILRRAAEVAPAMGLIGTLVGLVQMLAQLQDPESIGPAMAVALLTTFYGAIMGTVILSPLAAKLERNSGKEALIRTLIMHAMISIAAQENPRRLEMVLNAELPPAQRIRYFD